MRFFVFSLLLFFLAWFIFDWSFYNAIQYSSFSAGFLILTGINFFVALLDLIVLWEYETFEEIIKKRNLPYAIYLSSLHLVGIAVVILFRS